MKTFDNSHAFLYAEFKSRNVHSTSIQQQIGNSIKKALQR